MEGKLSSASSKLRNLKEFLGSTRGLSHQNQNQFNQSPSSSSKSRAECNSVQKVHRAKNSISLFNIMNATTVADRTSSSHSDRPISTALAMEPYGYKEFSHNEGESGIRLVPKKSVSLYGLAAEKKVSHDKSGASRNPAVRLFYTIRSKFRRKRRDRSKVVDSADFGSFLSVNPITNSATDEIDTHAQAYSARYQLKSSKSVDNVLDNFASLFGSRVNDTESRHESDNDKVTIIHPHLIETTTSNFPSHANIRNDCQSSNQNRASQSNLQVIKPSISPIVSPPKTQKCLTKELGDLLHYGWYWGGLSKDEAEEKLKGEPNGAFVVRDSSSDHYLLSLSFNSNARTLHTRIEYRNGQFCFYSSEADSFSSVAELIEHCIAYSEVGVFCYSKARRSDCLSYPVRLTKPISRFTEVKSLLYLSRFVIRQIVRLDLIPLLPLPPSLLDFIAEQRYI